MSFDIGVSDNERNELPCYIGNDGCVLENERSTYSYFSPPLNGSPIPDRSVKASFLSTIKEVFTDSFGSDHNEIPVKMNRSMVINGLNVTTVTPAVITKMSVENANSFLNQVFIEGYLFKKGFRRLRLWKKRYFVLRSNVLLYYDKTDHTVPRRRCEITPDCKVMMENIPGRPYAFSMVPCKGQCPYFLDGLSNQERDVWIHYFSLVQLLTKRLCTNLPRSPKQSILDIISLQETLGKGAYGVVRLGRYLDTGEMCAVKVINKQKVGKDILDCELAVIRKVKNEIDAKEIVRIYDVFEDTYLVYIVMEYMGGGDLHSRLIHNPVFSESQAASIIHCIARGIHILHQKNIYHLDVKPENIIYESNDKHSAMKLTDFGCSLLVEHLNRDTNEIVGTAGYMAPEVISNYNYSEKADVYSLGVILFILLMGYPPFEGNSSEELLHKTVNNRIEYNEEDWEGVSADALLLVKNMLAKNPEERLSIEEVLSFPWVSNPCKSYRKSLRSSHPLLDFSLPTTLPGSKLYSVASIVC